MKYGIDNVDEWRAKFMSMKKATVVGRLIGALDELTYLKSLLNATDGCYTAPRYEQAKHGVEEFSMDEGYDFHGLTKWVADLLESHARLNPLRAEINRLQAIIDTNAESLAEQDYLDACDKASKGAYL